MAEVPVRPNTPNAGGLSGQQLIQQNDYARRVIRARAQDMIQLVQSNTIANPGSTNNIVNVSPRYVGYLKRFWVEVIATVANSNGGSTALTLTTLGAANILSRIQLVDLSNNTRHNDAGWHMYAVASAKRSGPFAAAYTTDNPCGYGNNFDVIKAPSSIAAGASGTVRMIYEVPVTYDDYNLAGGIWLGVTQATMNLQLTINPAPGANSASDTTLSVYKSATGAADCAITSVTINVYQNYLDQLPVDQNGRVILPVNDISTVYMLQDTVQTGMTANLDFPVPYANARDFLSTFVIYDNNGTLNAGSDVNTWGIQAANFINFKKYDPQLAAMIARLALCDDTPLGMYYFPHRDKPVSTAQFGNTELVLNASSVSSASGSKLLVGYEMFALVNLVAQAGALAVA